MTKNFILLLSYLILRNGYMCVCGMVVVYIIEIDICIEREGKPHQLVIFCMSSYAIFDRIIETHLNSDLLKNLLSNQKQSVSSDHKN